MNRKDLLKGQLQNIKMEVGEIMRAKEGLYRRMEATQIELGQLEIRHQTLRYERETIKAQIFNLIDL